MRRSSPGPERPSAVVIGGGAAGVAAALELAGAGRRVVLLEAGTGLGGRARSFREPGSGMELDWGPHLFMSANPAWRGLLDRIGAASDLEFGTSLKLDYRQAASDGVRRIQLVFPAWGGSILRLAALLRWKGPSFFSRLEIGRGLLRLLRVPGREDESVAWMLERLGQGAEARKWFWEPFSRAVLNLPPEKGSAALFRNVLVEAFGAGGAGAALGVPSVPLGALWTRRAAEKIRALGGEVRTGIAVREILVENMAAAGVGLPDGVPLKADAVISAVPPPQLYRMIPEHIRHLPPWAGLFRLEAAPIATAYIWLEERDDGPAFEVLLDEPWEWLFRPQVGAEEEGRLIALLAEGEDSIAPAARAALEASALETAARIFPGIGIRKVRIVRERRATWANSVDEQKWRPGAPTPIENLYLAGDWTATGLPATVEGAVRSGLSAARAVLLAAERA